jgi:pimeloyl-ACP methyl ester carboxylesterase
VTPISRGTALTALAAGVTVVTAGSPASASTARPPRRRFEVRTGGAILRGDASLCGRHPVVFLHGWSFGAAQWDAQLCAVGDRGWLRYDQRGHLASTGGDQPYEFGRLVDDLEAVLDALHVRRPVLVGQSMGGMVALEYAVTRRRRLAGLALVATGLPDATDRANAEPTAAAMLDRATYEGLWAVLEPLLFSADFRARAPERVARWRERYWSAQDNVAMANAYRAFALRADLGARLGEVRVPTLVLSGRDDAIFPPARIRLLLDGLPEAESVVLPAGHMVNLERPLLTTLALRRWLDRHVRR